jgi:hypothetical protein
MALRAARSAKGRQVGIYILPGFDQAVVAELKTAFLAAGIIPKVRPTSSTLINALVQHAKLPLSRSINRRTCQGLRLLGLGQLPDRIHIRDLPIHPL